MFENERFLPFRGWGHEWPGHLLPTDRVGHWSLRGDRPSGAESMDFHRVAPPLPKVCAAALTCSHPLPPSQALPPDRDSTHQSALCRTQAFNAFIVAQSLLRSKITPDARPADMHWCLTTKDLSWVVQAWQWLDEDWHIDMTGHEDACVDNEGWYYAVDFNWLKHPPAPGSGRFKRVCQLSISRITPCSSPMCTSTAKAFRTQSAL